MRVIRTALIFAIATIGFSAHAAEPEYVMSCEDVITQLHREATAEAKARFADLAGSCLGVVERDDELYMHTKMVVRRLSGSKVTLYLPATDRTFEVDTSFNERVRIGNNRVRVRDLSRGQELNLYIAVDEFTQPIIEEVAFETDVEDEIVVAPAVMAAALPTTG